MSIDDMPAGRELDALVAEKVMGWQDARAFFPWPESGVMLDNYAMMPPHGGAIRDIAHVPRYSTDIAAAWEVFQKVTDLGYIPAIAQCTSGWACDFWTEEAADETGRVDYIHKFREYGQASAPLAICRAALKAVDA